jgi:hypothetical protein
MPSLDSSQNRARRSIVLIYAVAALAIGAVWLWSRRANELFCLSVRDGRMLLIRGRIPGSLFGELEDIVRRPPVARATIRASRESGGAHLSVSGTLDGGQEQRLRNVFHLYPMSNLRSAPGSSRRTWAQVLGIVWLAWLLDRSQSS